MIKIALDETGSFEFAGRTDNLNQLMAIGGVVFTYEDDTILHRETGRIGQFLRSCCESCGASFPQALHANTGATPEQCAQTEEAFVQGFSDFVHYRGVWATNQPHGKYSLYVLAGDRFHTVSAEAGGNLGDENFATNRYDHMVGRVLENLLLYCPELDLEQDVSFDLATRTVNLEDRNRNINVAEQAELDTLDGHDARAVVDATGRLSFDRNRRVVTDAGIFRTIITQTVQDTERANSNYRINVRSINYTQDYSDQHFLYLADMVCSLFNRAFKALTARNLTSATTALLDTCRAQVGDRSMVWVYDRIDRTYHEIYNQYRYGNYFNALHGLETLRKRAKGACEELYVQRWLPGVAKLMTDNVTPNKLLMLLDEMNIWLDTREATQIIALGMLDQIQLMYDAVIQRDSNTQLRDRLMFQMHKCRMTIHNHEGNFVKAIADYKEAMKSAHAVDLEELLDMKNRHIVALLDAGRTREAVEEAENAALRTMQLTAIKKEIDGGNDAAYISYGRTLSQLGQAYAHAGQSNEAIDQFTEALAQFGTSEGDTKRTMSYLLHALIEADNRELYEQYAEIYFGTNDPMKQLEMIPTQQAASERYAIYVFIKGFYHFYSNGEHQLNANNIRSTVDAVKRIYDTRGDRNPWEMILKYCALLLTVVEWRRPEEKRDFTAADELMTKAAAAVGVDRAALIGSTATPDALIGRVNAIPSNDEHALTQRQLLSNEADFLRAKAGDFGFAADAPLKFMYR